MIYICYSCNGLKVKVKDNPKIVIRGTGWEKERLICEKCASEINLVYEKTRESAEAEGYFDEAEVNDGSNETESFQLSKIHRKKDPNRSWE